ncbi:MAG: alpha-glucan family phosphorylase [Desulfovibrionales bacterium]|nr:alpha-glucan family phosphorylase [Desulfovibrionales bacterium]
MQPLKIFNVIPKLPDNLNDLWKLAYNFRFTWCGYTDNIFKLIDQQLWATTSHNPLLFLHLAAPERLEAVANDPFILSQLKLTMDTFNEYFEEMPPTPIEEATPQQPAVAYFSFEFGVASCMPIYSGGLGILAGDHLKSASDMNIPLVGVGLLYKHGYYRQYLTPDGWQQESYPDLDFTQIPILPIEDEEGRHIRIPVPLGKKTLYAQLWKAQIGRITLILMDTELPENPPELRPITASLYGGDREMRLWQEILLGIGGMKALETCGYHPQVIHMNEGHSAFAGVERIRSFMQKGMTFESASEIVASSSIFTTHTPVPAGNDRFSPVLMERYFSDYAKDLGLAFKVFLSFGRENPFDEEEEFCMTVLAIKLSRFTNGVSQLHKHVSRKMWKALWPLYPHDDIPISAVTNGIHAPTWTADDMREIYDRYLGNNWREDPDSEAIWQRAETISDAELWRTHERLRARLVDFSRKRLREQLQAHGARKQEVQNADEILNPQALTIGFARRFATYKRANLIMREKEKLLRLFRDNDRPIQLVFAGKAHPADAEGKKYIKEIVSTCRSLDYRFNMVFLEDYDIEIAKHMLAGCDVWLNTPRRPYEACGTSGIKAIFNGVLTFSTLDGWWDEAYLPDNSIGWAIGKGEEYSDPEYQDYVELRTLFNVLEFEIIPEFYDRGRGGLPRQWIRRMKKALTVLGPKFNSHRMVMDYVHKTYKPAYDNFINLSRYDFQPARELADWRNDIMTKWSGLEIRNAFIDVEQDMYVGQSIKIGVDVKMNGIHIDSLSTEAYFGQVQQNGEFSSRKIQQLMPIGEQDHEGWQHFEGIVAPKKPGRFGYTIRIIPQHPLLIDPRSLGLIRWAIPKETS